MIRYFQIPIICIINLFFIPNSLAYDPLQKINTDINMLELEIDDKERARKIPILVYLPETNSPLPVILFSHGLGGSRHGSSYLGKNWASRNYIAVFLQHPGSDDSVWKNKNFIHKLIDAKKAASAENFKLRVFDVYAVLDQLELWNKSSKHPLAGKMDMSRIGMSGHSFGAVTTQAVSGQVFSRFNLDFTDKRIKAAVIFSPSPPKHGGTANEVFGSVNIPWMLMTGTNDDSVITKLSAQKRLEVFPALPNGNKYQLVLDKADHFAFSERSLKKNESLRNPNHHKAIMALSNAFWDSYLKDDANAKEWLDGNGARNILEHGDNWQMK